MSPRLVQAFCYFRKSFTHLSIWRLCSQVVFKPKPLICKEVVFFFIIVVIIIIFLDLLHHALFESCLVYEQIITIGHRMILKTKMLVGCDVRIESVMSPVMSLPLHGCLFCSSLLRQCEACCLQKWRKCPSLEYSGFRKFPLLFKLSLTSPIIEASLATNDPLVSAWI